MNTWHSRGAAAWYDDWWQALESLRSGYADVVCADSTDIALHASISTATAVVASVLDYESRPKVVTTSLDFPTVAYQWLARKQDGVELVVVPSPDEITVPVDDIAAAVDERTALVATSHVFFTTGAIQDVEAVVKVAHENGAYCLVDAYQSVGQMPVDAPALGVDFLCAGGLKWLLGGPGVVFLYARHDLIDKLWPRTTGWFANSQQFEFNPHRITWHADARRLEQGTPSLAAVFTQLGGLEIIREIGIPAIREVVSELTDDLVQRATAAGLSPKVAPRSEDRGAIVMIPADDPDVRVRKLAAANIIADARPGHVRLSPFFYNLKDDNGKAIEVLRS